MSEHTKEPWKACITIDERAVDHKGTPYIESADSDVVIADVYGGSQRIANARRIVSCVNKCAAFTTEQLEDEKWMLLLAVNPDGPDMEWKDIQ